ncbi:MAG: DUF2934 domain-containing protein [Acidobacteriia bacterium]|jgi:hypothetical protein|nr:DUF2934 domain-containing protein [Terriglobia bacterium]
MPKATSGKNGGKGNRKPTTESTARRPVAVFASAARSDGSLEERIRQRAYELYEQEGRQEGRDQEYWFRAEAEILGRRSA